MGFDPIEAIKFIGGIGGILSTAFLIYDRLYKSQPTVFFQPHDSTACLVIKNTMTETLFIDAIDVSPRKISFARDKLQSSMRLAKYATAFLREENRYSLDDRR